MERIADFFVEAWPSPRMLVLLGPVALLWAGVSLRFAGFLKLQRGWPTGYTRKVFHFAIFFSVAVVQALGGLSAACLWGGMTSLVILHALLRGEGYGMYEAMAREKDAPHRTHYIVVPYFATLLGGLAANMAFGPVAVVGYLVTGLGDAVGEPVGTRYGRHTYRVPSLRGIKAVRSFEGSAAVVLMSAVGLLVAVALSAEQPFVARMWWSVPVLALASGLVEAVSPHGWDNFTLQVVPTGLAAAMW